MNKALPHQVIEGAALDSTKKTIEVENKAFIESLESDVEGQGYDWQTRSVYTTNSRGHSYSYVSA